MMEIHTLQIKGVNNWCSNESDEHLKTTSTDVFKTLQLDFIYIIAVIILEMPCTFCTQRHYNLSNHPVCTWDKGTLTGPIHFRYSLQSRMDSRGIPDCGVYPVVKIRVHNFIL
jgi:hypothetical protein